MSQNKILCVFLVLSTIIITACGGVTQIVSTSTPEFPTPLSTTPTETKTVYSTITPDDSKPLQTFPAGQYGVVKLSLEATRGGKVYEIPLGYDIGRAWWNQDSKTPDLPQTYGENLNVNDVNTQWIGDIDADGNLEYIVELVFCGAYCSSEVQIIHYDSAMDGYRAFDKFSGYGVENYLDVDNDGNPEIISQDYDYQFKAGGATATRWLAPIKIYQYDAQEQKFRVVTSKYPDLVTKNAVRFLDEAKSKEDGFINSLKLASYLYDMYILGQQEEGTKVFNDVCQEKVKPTIGDSDWTCENYLARVQKTLSEMKIGSE
jgi:hypothetical protein